MQDERNIAFKSFISSDTHSSLINITSTGREKFHLPFFFFSLFIVFCTFSCNKVRYPFIYNQIHFHVENPFCLKLCLLRVQEKQGGGTVILIFLKNIHTRMYLAVRKRVVGKSLLGHGSKRGHKGTGGHCWAREEETELVLGTCWWWEDPWQLLLGNPTGWGHIFWRAVQRVTVLVLDWFYMRAQQLIIINKIKWEDNSSRFQFARCTISTRHNRLLKIASFIWFSSGLYCWTQAPHLSQASSVLPFPEAWEELCPQPLPREEGAHHSGHRTWQMHQTLLWDGCSQDSSEFLRTVSYIRVLLTPRIQST